MDLTIKRKYNTNMLTHSILNNPNNPLLAPCLFNGNGISSAQNSPPNSSISMNSNSTTTPQQVNAQLVHTSANIPSNATNTNGLGSSANIGGGVGGVSSLIAQQNNSVVNDQLIQEELIKHLQKYNQQMYLQELVRQYGYEDLINSNILLQSQLMYASHPSQQQQQQQQHHHHQYNPQFTHLRTSTTTTLPSSSQINMKSSAVTRSPSLSPSSPIDDVKFNHHHHSHNNNNKYENDDGGISDEPPFPRFSSIESISKKLNNMAKIECNHQNDENNNPAILRSSSNDKIISSSQNKYQQQQFLLHQHQQQQQQLYANNKLALSTGLLNNNKEGNKLDLNIKPALSSSSLNNNNNNNNNSSNSSSSSNGSNNNLNNLTTTSTTSNNNNGVFVPPCTSNGISSEIREKLRQNILKRQDKNNLSPTSSTSNLNGSNNNLNNINNNNNNNNNNSSKNNSINNFLLSNQLYDDTVLPRSISEPNFIPNKIKSVLKDNIKKRMNPMSASSTSSSSSNNTNSNNKRPQITNSPPKLKINNNNTTTITEEIPTPVLAAVPSLKLNKDINSDTAAALVAAAVSAGGMIQPPPQQQYPFNALFNRSLFLNQSQPYLNNLQWQALATAAALENANANSTALSAVKDHHQHNHHHHTTSLSMSSLPNPNQMQAKRQRTSPTVPIPTTSSSSSSLSSNSSNNNNNRSQYIRHFGNIVHVEEESEMLLANELRDASKADEEMQNAFMYGQDDDDEDEDSSSDDIDGGRLHGGIHSYNTAVHHRHPKHLFKKICYSDPYLMRSNLLLNKQLQHAAVVAAVAAATAANGVNDDDDRITESNESLASSQTALNNSRLNDRRNTLSAETAMDFATSEHRPAYKYTTGIVYDSRMLKHECTCNNPRNHIETPARLEAIWERFEARGVVDECEVIKAKTATIEDIVTCHSESYASIFGADINERAKLSPEYLQEYYQSFCIAPCSGWALVSDQDNSWNEANTPVACRVAIGSTYELADLVTQGKLKNGFALVRPPGSHAEYNRPLGFCYFNNVAIAAKLLKKNLNLERILIVDWDVHHGNGTQQLTYDDPNILYISLHRHDNGKFFPGSGSIDECGTKNGLGYNVNIAWSGKLEPPMGDAEYLAAFRTVVMPIAKAFKPQLVLVSSGFDGTESHPKELGGYKLTPMLFAYMTKKLMSLAEGKVVLVLEGGYDLPSLCDCSEMCVNALMNKQIPSFPNETLDAIPNNPAIQTLEQVIEVQKRYWPNIQENSKYIRMSQNQFIRIDTAE